MTTDRRGGQFLLGLLVGAGLGLTAALLLATKRPLPRLAPLERVRDVADRARSSRRGRKAERAGKALTKQIDRMRSAGL